MKPYGGLRDKRKCPIHGDGCRVFYKDEGKQNYFTKKATRHSERQKAKDEILEFLDQNVESNQDESN